MQRLIQMLSALADLALPWCLLAGPARADNPCRQSVVIYLDVSGSMYEQGYMSTPAWSKGRKVTLMENTVHFLETQLLAADSLALRPGDTLTLRGFYSKVDNLAGPIRDYNPGLHAAAIASEAKDRLDFNRDGQYDLADALPQANPKGRENAFLAPRPEARPDRQGAGRDYVLETDFVNVVEDMVNKFRETPLGSGGPQGYEKLVFIILTDGGQENLATQELFKQKIREAGELMKARLDEGRVQVHFFGVVATNRGAYLRLHHRQDVSFDFKEHLHATLGQVDMAAASLDQINAILAQRAERIEIEQAPEPRYKYPEPPAAGEPRPAASASGTIVAPLNLVNHSCRGLTLQEVRCVIYRSPGAVGKAAGPPAGRTPLDNFVYPAGRALGGRASINYFDNLEVSYQRHLEPGRYQLDLVPVSKELGQGARKTVDLEVPQPPAPPEEPFDLPVYLLGLAVLAGLAGLVWHFTRKPGS